MFTPKYSLNNNITFDLEQIDRIKFRVERLLIMPKHEEWLRRQAFIRTAYSSTMVENPNITTEEMEQAAKSAPTASFPRERKDVANYAKALEFVDFLSESQIVTDEQVIRQVHWLLMNGMNDSEINPGKYRTKPNWIEDKGIKVYEPPISLDVPILMRDFSLWLRDNKNVKPILKAGIAALHLIAIHPFVDGNGRTARLLATLILQQLGYGFRRLLSLDAYFQRNRDDYIRALRAPTGATYSPEYDSTPWLEFFTRSITLQARMLEDQLTDWRMMVDSIHKVFGGSGLNERQIDGIIYCTRMGRITRKDYALIGKVSLLTASRDLSVLVNKGFMKPEGVGRARFYRMAQPR